MLEIKQLKSVLSQKSTKTKKTKEKKKTAVKSEDNFVLEEYKEVGIDVKEDIKESPYIDGEEIKDKLNLRQEKFCQLYATHKEFFGNGTQSYIEAYNPKRKGSWYITAQSNASKLLRNTNICARISQLIESEGFNDENVDKQHLFCINQFDDLKTKIKAIDSYNSLKKRVENASKLTGEVVITYVPKKDDKE